MAGLTGILTGIDFGQNSVFPINFFTAGANDGGAIITRITQNRFNSKDCNDLDKSLKEAKDSLAYLKAEKLNGYKMNLPNQPLFIKEALDYFINWYNTKASSNFKRNQNVNSFFGSTLDNILPTVIMKVENAFVDGGCRNKIEQIRLEESALLLSTQSAIQEKNVLPSNYKEQYIYIGLGSLVLLVGLYVIAKK